MTIWTDAHLSPAIAKWITENYPAQATALRDLGFRDSTDRKIFEAARQAEAVVMTKDSNFVEIVKRLGSPPQIIWLTCGNTSNAYLKKLLAATLPQALALLEAGEPLVEIGAA